MENTVPPRPHKPCRKPGCSRLTQDASGYCDQHQEWALAKEAAALAARRKAVDDRRGSATERGYNATWRKARATFLRRNPLCVDCGRPATVVDHIVPHRGDTNKFWDTENWQPLCAACHNRKTARGE